MKELLETYHIFYEIQKADLDQGYLDLTMSPAFSEDSEVTDVAEVGGAALIKGVDYYVLDGTLCTTFNDGDWFLEGNTIEIIFTKPCKISDVDQDELDLAGIGDVIDGIYLELNDYYGITGKEMKKNGLEIDIKRPPFFYHKTGLRREEASLIVSLSQAFMLSDEKDLISLRVDSLEFFLKEEVYSPFISCLVVVIKEKIRKGEENDQ